MIFIIGKIEIDNIAGFDTDRGCYTRSTVKDNIGEIRRCRPSELSVPGNQEST